MLSYLFTACRALLLFYQHALATKDQTSVTTFLAELTFVAEFMRFVRPPSAPLLCLALPCKQASLSLTNYRSVLAAPGSRFVMGARMSDMLSEMILSIAAESEGADVSFPFPWSTRDGAGSKKSEQPWPPVPTVRIGQTQIPTWPKSETRERVLDASDSNWPETHPQGMISRSLILGKITFRQGLDTLRGYVGSPKDRKSGSMSTSAHGSDTSPAANQSSSSADTPGDDAWKNWIQSANLTLMTSEEENGLS